MFELHKDLGMFAVHVRYGVTVRTLLEEAKFDSVHHYATAGGFPRKRKHSEKDIECGIMAYSNKDISLGRHAAISHLFTKGFAPLDFAECVAVATQHRDILRAKGLGDLIAMGQVCRVHTRMETMAFLSMRYGGRSIAWNEFAPVLSFGNGRRCLDMKNVDHASETATLAEGLYMVKKT